MYDVTVDYAKTMQKLYPALNIEQQFNEMLAWCISNPKNRKTSGGIKRFINSWLSRSQDRAPRAARNNPYPKKNGFNNYEQSNVTDYEKAWDYLVQEQLNDRSGTT